jgi:thiamine kinase-like enzyme
MKSPLTPNFPEIVRRFTFEGNFLSAQPFGNGHIHDTYAAIFATGMGKKHRYILQKINTHVFPRPIQVMENIQKITEHLRRVIEGTGGDPLRETLTLIPAKDGNIFYQEIDGCTWRALLFIEGAQTYQTVSDPNLYDRAAKAFGRFQVQLADFPTDNLHMTLPDFHNTPWRFNNFKKALEEDLVGRAEQIRYEVDFLLQRQNHANRLIELEKAGEIPIRVTHNDTKLDNVMIDDLTGEAICVIDLDTVMPGLALYDFGDSVRSATNPANEDESDLSKVCFNIQVFERLVRGYLSEAGPLLTQAELNNLAFSGWLITYEQALRFLGDHLNGDTYYKIQHPGHNLDRARTQIKLIQGMESSYEKMENLVKQAG